MTSTAVETSSGFKHLGEAMARRMHPDLDWPKPSPEVEDKLFRYELSDQYDDLQRVIFHPDIEVGRYGSPHFITCTVSEWKEVDGKYGTVIDTEATRRKLAKGMKALQSLGCTIEKEYSNNYFKIIGTFASDLKITLSADREVACTKRVVGKKYVPPSGGHYQEVVEWDCERIAFSALDV